MTDVLNSIAGNWWNWQFAMLWQTAILVGILWGIDFCIRKWAHPQVRYALWMLVLVKLLLPPTLTSPASFTAYLPGLAEKAVQVQIAPTPQPVEQSVIPVIAEAETEAAAGRERTGEAEPVTNMAVTEPTMAPSIATQTEAATEMEQAGNTDEPAAISTQVPSAGVSLSWKVYAMGVWFGGMAVLGGWLIVRLSGLRREHIHNDSDYSLPERFFTQLELAGQKLGLRRLPRVILTDKVACPAVFGLFRPVLLMPAGKLKRMTQQDVEHILLHELAHIKRGDLWVHALHVMLQIVYWFNPLLWLVRRPLQNLRELCCDATVARLLKDKTYQYRETLLETARQLLAEPVDPGLGLLGLFENSNWLVTRLQWLEKNTWKNQKRRIAAIAILVALMTTCVLPMANRSKIEKIPECFQSLSLPYSVWMADIDGDDMKVLDLVSGDIKTIEDVKDEKDFVRKIESTSEGDIFATYKEEIKKPMVTFLRGAGLHGDRASDEYLSLSPIPMEMPYETVVTTKRGYKFKFRIVSADENACDIEYWPINRKAKKAMAQTHPSDDYKVNLPNGVTVELVGICECPSDGRRWWRPDGSWLDESRRPYVSPGGKSSSAGHKVYEAAFQVSGAGSNDASFSIPEIGMGSGKFQGGITGYDFRAKPEAKEIDFEVKVGSGPWQVLAQSIYQGEDSWDANAQSHAEGGILFAKPFAENKRSWVTISHTIDSKVFNVRFVAITNDGKEITPIRSEGGGVGDTSQQTLLFDCPLDQLKAFHVQIRKYQGITFKNVALRPQKQGDFKVTGTVTDAETDTPIAGAEVYDDGYNNNKCSTTTDANGNFTLNTDNEEHTVSAKAEGYQLQTKTLKTWPFANHEKFDFKLEKIASIGKINLPVGTKGMIVSLHGDAIYGSQKAYSSLMYLGRVKQGQEVELMDTDVYCNQFSIPIVKVKTRSSFKEAVPEGTIGWVQLQNTDFAPVEYPSIDRTFYFKLPLAQPRFHWKFTNKELYLSGRLVLRIIRDDQVNEIVIFDKGKISEGWEAMCSKRGPQENAIYFGFESTAKYSTRPSDKVELELIAKEDIDGIGRLQTGVLKAGTHETEGKLKLYRSDNTRAYIEWPDKWLLNVTSEKGWYNSQIGLFINDNGTMRPLTNAEKKRMVASVGTRSFFGNSEISFMETTVSKNINEKHFRNIRMRKNTIKQRIDIIEYADEKKKKIQLKTTLIPKRDSGGSYMQRVEHSEKKVFIENDEEGLKARYDIFKFGRIDSGMATKIRILCDSLGDDNQAEPYKPAAAFSDTADVDLFQMINLKDNRIVNSFELNKMDWGLCRKIQWFNKDCDTLSKSVEYADFKRPVEFKTSANSGDSGYLLPYKTLRRYFNDEGIEEKTENLEIFDAAMASHRRKHDYNTIRRNYGKDFDVEIPDDYTIIDRRDQSAPDTCSLDQNTPQKHLPAPRDKTQVERKVQSSVGSDYVFGPEVELVVQDAATAEKFMVDLESGKVLTPEKTLAAAYDPDPHDRWSLRICSHEQSGQFTEWITANGADIVAESGQGLQLIGGFASRPVINPPTVPGWDEVTADDVVEHCNAWRGSILKNRDVSSVTASLFDLTERRPEYHYILTRDGARGILQVLEMTENPKGVKFRYKLVQSGVQKSEGSHQKPREATQNTAPVPDNTIVERTLSGPKQFGGFDADLFDFRTNTVFDFPPKVKFWDVPEWMAERGVDVVCVPSENGPTLTGNGKIQNAGGNICKFAATQAGMDSTFSDLERGWQEADSQEILDHNGWDNLPRRFFFKSRSGDNGILEVTAIDDIARTITFRYKLFEQRKQSMNFEFKKDMPLVEALRMLSKMYEVNIVPSQVMVNDPVILGVTHLYDVTFEEALKAVCGSAHTYVKQGNLIYVYRVDEFEQLKKANLKKAYDVLKSIEDSYAAALAEFKKDDYDLAKAMMTAILPRVQKLEELGQAAKIETSVFVTQFKQVIQLVEQGETEKARSLYESLGNIGENLENHIRQEIEQDTIAGTVKKAVLLSAESHSVQLSEKNDKKEAWLVRCSKRWFVQVVADEQGQLWYEGQQVTFEQLEKMLKAKPTPPKNTVLEVGYTGKVYQKLSSEAVEEQLRRDGIFRQAKALVDRMGFEYLSFVGCDNPDDRRGPISHRIEDRASFCMGRDIEAKLSDGWEMLTINSVRFEQHDSTLSARMNMTMTSYPKTKWEIGFKLYDKNGEFIDSVFHYYENSGIVKGIANISGETLGFDFENLDAGRVAQFEIEVRKYADKQKVSRLTKENDIFLVPLDFTIPRANFEMGDSIEITEILGTGKKLEVGHSYIVKGRYTLASRGFAKLYLYATNGETRCQQGPVVSRGSGEFSRLFTYVEPGDLHLSFYPNNGGSSFSSVYFDSKQTVPESSLRNQAQIAEWKTVAESYTVEPDVPTQGATVATDYGTVTFGNAYEKKGTVFVQVADSIDRDLYEVRIVAIDKGNKVIEQNGGGSSGFGNVTQNTVCFDPLLKDIKLKDIKLFRLQIRSIEKAKGAVQSSGKKPSNARSMEPEWGEAVNDVRVKIGGTKPLGLFYSNNTLWFEVQNDSPEEISLNQKTFDPKDNQNGWGYLEVVDAEEKPIGYIWNEKEEIRQVKPGQGLKNHSFMNGRPLRKSGPGYYNVRLVLTIRTAETNKVFYLKSNWHTFEVTVCGYPKDYVPRTAQEQYKLAAAYALMKREGHATDQDKINKYQEVIDRFPNSKYAMESWHNIIYVDHMQTDNSCRKIVAKWPDVVTDLTRFARSQVQSRYDYYHWLKSITDKQIEDGVRNYSIRHWFQGGPSEGVIQEQIENLKGIISRKIQSIEQDPSFHPDRDVEEFTAIITESQPIDLDNSQRRCEGNGKPVWPLPHGFDIGFTPAAIRIDPDSEVRMLTFGDFGNPEQPTPQMFDTLSELDNSYQPITGINRGWDGSFIAVRSSEGRVYYVRAVRYDRMNQAKVTWWEVNNPPSSDVNKDKKLGEELAPTLKIVDKETGKPIPNCGFRLAHWNRGPKTNFDGIYNNPKDGFAERLRQGVEIHIEHPHYETKKVSGYTLDENQMLTVQMEKEGTATLSIDVKVIVRGEETDAGGKIRLFSVKNNNVVRDLLNRSIGHPFVFSGLKEGPYRIETHFYGAYPHCFKEIQLKKGEHKKVEVVVETDQLARIPVAGKLFHKGTGEGIEGGTLHFVGAPSDDGTTDKDGLFSTQADRSRFDQTLLWLDEASRRKGHTWRLALDGRIDAKIAGNLQIHVDPEMFLKRRYLRDFSGDGIYCDGLHCVICDKLKRRKSENPDYVRVAGKLLDKRTGKGFEGAGIRFGNQLNEAHTYPDGSFAVLGYRERLHQLHVYSHRIRMDRVIDEESASHIQVHVNPEDPGRQGERPELRDDDGDGIYCDGIDCVICEKADGENHLKDR